MPSSPACRRLSSDAQVTDLVPCGRTRVMTAAGLEMAQERDEVMACATSVGEGADRRCHARQGPHRKMNSGSTRWSNDHRQQHEENGVWGVPGAAQHRHHEGQHVENGTQREKITRMLVGHSDGPAHSLGVLMADNRRSQSSDRRCHRRREGGKQGRPCPRPRFARNVIRTDVHWPDENGRHGDAEKAAPIKEK